MSASFLVMGLFEARGQLQEQLGCHGSAFGWLQGCSRCRVTGLWGSSVGVRGGKAPLIKAMGFWPLPEAQGCDCLPPRTTSSRSSPTTSCRVSAACGPSTSTTISSPLRVRGEGTPGGGRSEAAPSLPCRLCGQLCGTSQNCPLLSRMETRGMAGAVALEGGSGGDVWEGARRGLRWSPDRSPGAAGGVDSLAAPI